MSAANGDRSRFHRIRKQKIARRLRDREMIKGIYKRRQSSTKRSSTAPKASIA